MKSIRVSVLGLLLTLQLLLSCGLSDYQNNETTFAPSMDLASKNARKSTVRVVGGNFSQAAIGSGFFVSRDKIVTNIHVILQPGLYSAKLVDKGVPWAVEGVTAFDGKNDLVILKISGEGTPLVLGNSDAVQSGEPIFAAGFPGGKYKFTEGKIHSIQNNDSWLKLKVELAAGNSGGPVLNSKGQVIGIVVRENETVGEGSYNPVIPSNTLKVLLAQLDSMEPVAEWQKRPQIQAYVNYGLGMEKYQKGRYKEAINSYDKAIELNTEYVDAYFNRGNAKLKLGVYDEAIADFSQAIKLEPRHAHAYNNRGSVLLLLGHMKAEQGSIVEAQQYYQDAIDDCTQAMRIVPDLAEAYGVRGRASLFLGNWKTEQGNIVEVQQYYQDAIDDYTQAIKLNPDDAKACYLRAAVKGLLGESKAEQGNLAEAQQYYQDAIDDCTQAIKINPDDAKVYHLRGAEIGALGKLKEKKGNMEVAQQHYQDAIDDCTQAIKLNPDDAKAYHTRGEIKHSLAKSEASRGWAKFLFKKPETGEKIKAARKLYQAAIADFNKSILLNPNFAKVYYDRARTKEILGQHDTAKEDFEKAKELDPEVGK